ncbi:subtilisin-type proteinase [Bifidobacterium cuniculi]|uniref:Subtilisin-type proteinase n=1 Tax=Bifidobacterium cuniculi TaxID=1688 RepID=A0A087AYQ9_9BIFI|nr:type VII secretion protein EccB [Bifidobacterium cuniculi]KFI63909.1 subtilisin-type proteinase [Bifidobacterium cuniculi]
MANKKDLSEAQGYSRRRLVTAFSSGIPDGTELTPKKNQTPVIVGAGLTVIAIIIGLFYGYLSPSLPDGWENNKLVVAKTSAARYVSEDGMLHPVINAVSAQLMIPAEDFEVITVDDDQLEGIPVTSMVGILGAPDALPERGQLVTGSLSSCTGAADALDNVLSNASSVPAPTAQGIVARVDGAEYLVTGSRRHRLPSDVTVRDEFLRALGIPQTAIVDVPVQWLNLFERGSDIAPLTFADGEAAHVADGVQAGSIVMQEDDPSETRYVVMSDGTISQLNDFTYAMVSVGRGGAQAAAMPLGATVFRRLKNADVSPLPADWPTGALTAVDAGKSMCAVLPLGSAGSVRLAVRDADAGSSGGADSSADVRQGGGKLNMRTTFDGGTGALLRAAIGSSSAGTVFAVDSTGTAYPVPQADDEVLRRLGYSAQDVQAVPRAWADVFPTGVELTVTAAGSSPVAGSAASAGGWSCGWCSGVRCRR